MIQKIRGGGFTRFFVSYLSSMSSMKNKESAAPAAPDKADCGGHGADLFWYSSLLALLALAALAVWLGRGPLKLAALLPLPLIAPAYYFYCLLKLRELAPGSLEQTADFILGPGSLLVGALQRRPEILTFLKDSFPRPPAAVAEIGRAKGGTLALLCRAAAPDALIISLDLPGAIHSGPIPAFNKGGWRRPLLEALAGPGQDLRLIDGDSRSAEAIALFEKALAGRKLDLLFIDGDHTYEGVKSDHERYARFVKPGGIIAFHDINPGLEEFGVAVSRFWRETPLAGERREFIEDPRQISYGIGALRLPG